MKPKLKPAMTFRDMEMAANSTSPRWPPKATVMTFMEELTMRLKMVGPTICHSFFDSIQNLEERSLLASWWSWSRSASSCIDDSGRMSEWLWSAWSSSSLKLFPIEGDQWSLLTSLVFQIFFGTVFASRERQYGQLHIITCRLSDKITWVQLLVRSLVSHPWYSFPRGKGNKTTGKVCHVLLFLPKFMYEIWSNLLSGDSLLYSLSLALN